MKECDCLCKEKSKGPKKWKGLTTFRIVELDIVRGVPGTTNINSVMAETKLGAIKKYYELHPRASDRILIYPEGCADIHENPLKALPPFKNATAVQKDY